MPEEAPVRKTTTRKRATKATTTRKAPARAPVAPAGEPRRFSYAPFIAVAVFILLLGGSAVIGFSDSGQINVNNTIADRKVSGTPEEQTQVKSVPVQQTRPTQPLGGLVPSKNKPTPAPEPKVESASTTATSSVTAEEATPAATEAVMSDQSETANPDNDAATDQSQPTEATASASAGTDMPTE